MNRHAAWGMVVAAGTALECYALLTDHELTLSRTTRALFHTDTRTGRLAYLLGYAAFSAWWIPHVFSEPEG